MEGIVRAISPINGLVAVETEMDEFTILEVFGGELEVGDTVSGALEQAGLDIFLRVDTGEVVRAFVEDSHATPRHTKRLLYGR